MKDMHSNIKVINAITPAAVGTSGAAGGKLSGVIDRRGYESVEFLFNYSTAGASTDTVTPIIYESDTATTAGFAAVADADLIGTEAAVVISAAGASKIGYRGNKRYVGIRLYGVGHATGTVGAVAILGNPNIGPVA